ncbi:hypothetical protein QBC43DRAFT_359383 [Cladorrhinum sp. PSN259]|nr:hypothetical protein QBC43DRAFT_359383 [Cladorrhinum sp. PSN259]
MGFQIDTSLGSLYSEMVALIACLDLVEQRIRRLVAEPFRFAGSEPRSFHFTVFSDCDNALTAIQRCNQTTLKTLSGTLSTIFRERKDSLINRMRDGLCVYVSGGLKWTPGHVFWLHEQADKIAGRACKEKRNIYMIDDAEISDQLPIVNAFKDDIRDAFIVEQARLFAALSLERRRGRGKKRRDSLAPINPGKVTKTTGTAATPILPNIFKTITESHVEPALGFDVTLDAADRSANSEPSSHTQQIISTGISFADDLATEISSTDINPSRRSSAAKIFRLELLREMADKLEKERQEREWSRMAEEQLYEEDAVAYDRHICETGRFHKYDDE